MSGRTRPEGYPVIQEPSRKHPSMTFVIALSVILGVVIAAGTILSVVGDAFYVTRSEYQDHDKKDIEMTTMVKQTLGQIDKTLSCQATSVKELAASVEGIRIDMAARRR